MADGYDRYDNESGGGSFVIGLLTGTVLGAGLGMLFAPRAGSELRHQISEQAGNLKNSASEGYRRASETAGAWAEKGREASRSAYEAGRSAYDKTRDAVTRGVDEAERYVREATESEGGATSGAQAYPAGETMAGARPEATLGGDAGTGRSASARRRS